MRQNYKFQLNIIHGFVYAFLLMFAAVMVMPFIWMLLNSFKSQAEIISINSFLPKVWTIKNYINVFQTVPIIRWFFNSTAVTVSGTTIVLFSSTLIGFVFAKYSFRFKNLLFMILIATIMVPPQTTMIPSFLMVDRLYLYDKLPSLVIPGMVSAFGVFLARQFIEDIPNSLCEAARIDGATDFYIYFRIILPLIRPAIGALAIFMFLMFWNEYMLPLLYINRIEGMTMPLAIAFFHDQRKADNGAIMAAATLVMLPVTVIFFLFQKQFIKGVAMTGMKS